jgi:hypothetical protein
MTKDEWYDNLDINDTLTMKATDQANYVELKTFMFTIPPPPAPILKIDQGMLVFKDLSSLGFLSSVSKTEIPFGATYTSCVPSDIGKQVRDDGVTIPNVVLAGYDNGAKKWWLSGLASVASGSAMTIVNGGTGAGTTSGGSSAKGGGAIRLGHGFTSFSSPPWLSLTDSDVPIPSGESFPSPNPQPSEIGRLFIRSDQGILYEWNGSGWVSLESTYSTTQDTLFLKKADGLALANLRAGKLTATGGAKLNAIAIGKDEYGDIPYEYESIQLNPAHNLRFCFGTNQRMMLSNAGRLELPVNGSGGGLKIGDDVTLYRSEQNVLKTDDSFVCSNIAGNDAIFNSVKGTYSGAALKAGDYLTLGWDSTNSQITAHNSRHLQLNTDSGYDVKVARNLSVSGVAKATGYVNTSPSVTNVTASRSFNTVYQNTTGKTIIVSVNFGVVGVGQPFYSQADIAIGPTSSPSYYMQIINNYINSATGNLMAVVPAGWYYKVRRNPDSDSFFWKRYWYEQVL